MADTEDVAMKLFEHVVGCKYEGRESVCLSEDTILDALHDIVIRWYIDIIDAKDFVRKMKARKELWTEMSK